MVAIPAGAFLERWNGHKGEPSWAFYLPAHLRPVPELLALSLVAAPSHQGARGNVGCPEHNAGGNVAAEHGACVAGRVWELSQDRRGCRVVQDALEHAESDEAREKLAAELKGHIWQAMQCPYANFVLQKCIMTMRPQALQFIVNEIRSKAGVVSHAAKHKIGCRILQRLLEHCQLAQMQELVEELLNDVVTISTDQYGNYVMQEILEHGTASQQHCLARAIEQNVSFIGSNAYGSSVLAEALSRVDPEDQVSLARAIVKQAGLLVLMACSKHGHTAVQATCALLGSAEREVAFSLLLADADLLLKSKHGCICLRNLELSCSCAEAASVSG